MITSLKRKRMEDLIYSVFSALDPTGKNTKHYREEFSAMSDKQFDSFFKDLFANENDYLTLTVVDYEIELTFESIEKAAGILKIPLFEKVYCPHYTMDKGNVISTKEPVPVGYCHIKRTQQILAKKNGLSTASDIRSALTGQVTASDKNGRQSDLENFMLISYNMKDTLKELNGPRSDDMVMKEEMITAISNKGYVSLEELDSDVVNKTTLNTVDTFLLGMGLNSDLVTKGLMLKKTLKEEEA